MAKLNVGALRAITPKIDTREFTDPEQPGATVSLTLRNMDALLYGRGQDLAAELKRKYLEEGLPFPPYIDGLVIEVSETLIDQTAPVCVMQTGTDIYTPEELIAIAATMPAAWIGIQMFSAEKQRVRLEDAAKNSSGAPSASP